MNFKLILLASLLIFSNCLFSQKLKTIANEIERDFKHLSAKQALELVPFQDKVTGKYGYISAVSKKIVVAAKYDKLSLFQFDITGSYQDESFRLKIKNNRMSLVEDVESQISFSDFSNGSGRGRAQMKRGFSVLSDDESKIDAYSHIYHNVYAPFRCKGKLYAIAEKMGEENQYTSAVIDEDGNIAFGLDFSDYKSIVLNKFAKDKHALYFFVVNMANELLFINTEGKQILMCEKNGSAVYDDMVVDWLKQIRVQFGYGLHENRILDFVKMEWLPSMTDENEIRFINYASDILVDSYTVSYLDYPNVKLYMWVKDKTYPYSYYMGWDGYHYIP